MELKAKLFVGAKLRLDGEEHTLVRIRRIRSQVAKRCRALLAGLHEQPVLRSDVPDTRRA